MMVRQGIASWRNVCGVAVLFVLVLFYVARDSQTASQSSRASDDIQDAPAAKSDIILPDRSDNVAIRDSTSQLREISDHKDFKEEETLKTENNLPAITDNKVGLQFNVTIRDPTLYSKHTRVHDETQIQEANNIQYTPPARSGLTKPGIPFNLTDKELASWGIPLGNISVLDDVTVQDFVFVIGASSNHFREAIDAIAGVQRYMANYTIFYYDLGLKDSEIEKIKTFCNVKYRRFDYSKYPRHVNNLYNYAFKPLIIHEVLQTQRAVVWMDASFRLLRPLKVAYEDILRTGGLLTFWHSPHTNYAVTDPGMYRYIPTDVLRQKRVESRGAAAIFWHKTAKVYNDVIYWWVVCALDEACIAPQGASLGCSFSKTDRAGTYANCHRYDMSVMNVLISNLYGYDTAEYTERTNRVVKLVKMISKTNTLQMCA